MRKPICIAVIFAALSFAPLGVRAMAPDAVEPAAKAEATKADPVGRLEQLHDAVKGIITDEQKAKVEEIFARAKEKVLAIKAEVEKEHTDLREALPRYRAVADQIKAELSGVLTEEQMATLKDKIGATAANVAGAAFQLLQENLGKLDLSEDQKQQLAQLKEETRKALAKVRDETQTQREAATEKVRQAMQETRQKVFTILTPQQRDKLQELMKESAAAATRPAP